MMAELMSLILLFLCPLLLRSVPEAVASPYPTYPIAKSNNCPYECGNKTIHFPFGIGANCFLDEWYEILCINNSVPRLKKLDLEVLDILFPVEGGELYVNTVTVNYPIFYSNSNSCTTTHYGMSEPVNFSGSPFLLSSDNSFLSVGCESVAKLRYGGHSFFGCSTECNWNKTRRYSSCDGLDCCRSTVPDGIDQGFSIDFQEKKSLGTSGGRDRDCQFALLVNSTWLEPGSEADLDAIRNMGYVPVVLQWGILDAAFPTSIGLPPLGQYSYDSSQSAAECYNLSTNVIMNTTAFINCFCIRGFYGNPYVEDGCKDINECEYALSEGIKICGGGLHNCRNTRGSYHCVKTTLFIIVGLCSSFGSLLMIFLAWWTYKQIKKRREAKLRAKLFKRNGGLILQQQLSTPDGNVEKGRLFEYKELETATDYFNKNRILGKGGHGTVYKGMLTDGRIVAIKKSIAIDEENVEPFINEVVILSQINHRNVVKLLGCCLESEVPLLVYEFIPNGTLYQYLHDQEFPVSWEVRLRIATEIAGALSYLHSSASIPIYHRDIKSSNILLDEKYRAKIADFGTSRSVALDQTHVTTVVQGTFGYLDPEYFQSSQFTDKSDVYSFGVVLVELLTGQQPVSSLRANEGRSLATYFIISMDENHLFDILDAHVLEHGKVEEITAVANLAKRCLNLKGRKRPMMKEVVTELECIRKPMVKTSGVEENQEIRRDDDTEAEAFGRFDALIASRGSEMEAEVISFSDVRPFLPSQSW